MLVSAQERNLRVQIPLAQRSLKAPAARARADPGRAKIPEGARCAAAALLFHIRLLAGARPESARAVPLAA